MPSFLPLANTISITESACEEKRSHSQLEAPSHQWRQFCSNSPSQIEGPKRRIIRQLVPGPDAKIDMVFIAARARVLDRHLDRVALAPDPVVAAGVGRLDLAPAEGSGGLPLLPEVAERADDGAVSEFAAAGGGSTFLQVDGAEAGVAGKVRRGDWREVERGLLGAFGERGAGDFVGARNVDDRWVVGGGNRGGETCDGEEGEEAREEHDGGW